MAVGSQALYGQKHWVAVCRRGVRCQQAKHNTYRAPASVGLPQRRRQSPSTPTALQGLKTKAQVASSPLTDPGPVLNNMQVFIRSSIGEHLGRFQLWATVAAGLPWLPGSALSTTLPSPPGLGAALWTQTLRLTFVRKIGVGVGEVSFGFPAWSGVLCVWMHFIGPMSARTA